MMPVHEELLREIQDFALTASTAMSLMERIAQCLHEKMMRNNWVGFYLVDPTDPGVLLVGPSAALHPMRASLVARDCAVQRLAAVRS